MHQNFNLLKDTEKLMCECEWDFKAVHSQIPVCLSVSALSTPVFSLWKESQALHSSFSADTCYNPTSSHLLISPFQMLIPFIHKSYSNSRGDWYSAAVFFKYLPSWGVQKKNCNNELNHSTTCMNSKHPRYNPLTKPIVFLSDVLSYKQMWE